MTTYKRIDRKGMSVRELSERTGLSRATISRHTSRSRAEYIADMAAEREQIRAFHDDEGHSWSQTAKHFGLTVDTVKRRAYRARKEREAERLAATLPPPLPIEF